MTKIENLEDKVMSIKDAVDNDNLKIIKFLTNNFTIYYSVFSNKAFTLPNHLVESNKLLVSFESIVQDSDIGLFSLSQLADFLTENFVGKNLIEL